MKMKQQSQARQKMKMSSKLIWIAATTGSILGITLFSIFVLNIGNIKSVFGASTTYYSRADGDWTDKNTWSTSSFTGKAASSYPKAGDNVYIRLKEVKISKSTVEAANLIIDNQGKGDSKLIISDGYSLSVKGDMSLPIKDGNGDIEVDVKDNSTLFIGGDLITDLSAGKTTILFQFDDEAKLEVTGNMGLDIAGGNSTISMEFYNKSQLNVGKNISVNVSNGSSNAVISVNDQSIIHAGGDLTLARSGGNTDITLEGNGSAQMNFDGSASLITQKGSGNTNVTLNKESSFTTGGNLDIISTTKYGAALNLNDESSVVINGNLNTSTSGAYSAIKTSDNSTFTFYNKYSKQAAAGGDPKDTIVIANMVVNNPAYGILLNTNIVITKSLKFESGLLVTTPKTMLVLRDGATCSGMTNKSYVEGPVRKDGGSAFEFPVGKNGRYAPLAIDQTKTYSQFTAEYFDEIYKNTTASKDLKNVSTMEYWTLSRDYGKGAPEVTLHWNDGGFSGIEELKSLKVAYYDPSNAIWQDAGQNTVSGKGGAGNTGYVKSNTIKNYLAFTFGSTSKNTLPVTLVNFDVKLAPEGVKVLWKTASEINNDYFQIERSINAKDFEPLAKVKGNGNAQREISYDYLDKSPLAGKSYYRLKQVDFNGAYEYFNIKPVEIAMGNIETVGPNPFRENFKVDFSLTHAGPVSLQLLTLNGTLAYADEINGIQGNNSYNYSDKLGLKDGIYILRLLKDGAAISSKIVKSH